MFQLQTEDMGPLKSTLSMAQGTPLLLGPSVLVQSVFCEIEGSMAR